MIMRSFLIRRNILSFPPSPHHNARTSTHLLSRFSSTSTFHTNEKVAHVIGAQTPPLLHTTIGQHLHHQSNLHAHNTALIVSDQNIHWSYSTLYTQSLLVAQGLLNLGLKKGDRLGVWMPNCSEWVLLQAASALIGVVLVSINPAYRKLELEHALNLTGCKALVMAPFFGKSDYMKMMREIAPEIVGLDSGEDLVTERVPELRKVIVATGCGRTEPDTSFLLLQGGGFIPFEELIHSTSSSSSTSNIEEICNKLDPHDIINIQFTSGTTGLPKGAALTHHGILNNGRLIGHELGLSPSDKVCIPVPLYHCFGSVLGNLACITHGSTMVYPKAGFDASTTLQTVQNEKCTALYGVPTMFITEMSLPNFKTYNLSSLRTGIMAGSICPIQVMNRVMNDMNMSEITICYGMTETSPVSFQTSRFDSPLHRSETVGRVHPHVECKVVHPSCEEEDGSNIMPVAPRMDANNEIYAGHLWTKGYNVMKQYWNDEINTQKAITKDGWMKTGDLASIDQDGYCRIVGRIKDIIIRGGENIHPREIEDVLFTSPSVKNVSAIGVPDEVYGEVVCVWIVPSQEGEEETEEDLEEHVRVFMKERVAHYKIPRYVLKVKEEDIPLTISGKIQKFVMRERTIEKLGL